MPASCFRLDIALESVHVTEDEFSFSFHSVKGLISSTGFYVDKGGNQSLICFDWPLLCRGGNQD